LRTCGNFANSATVWDEGQPVESDLDFESRPEESAGFASLPSALSKAKTYSELTMADRSRVREALVRLRAAVEQYPNRDLMPERVRTDVINDQQVVNTVLTQSREDSRLICQREKATGSNRHTTQCMTVAERARQKDKAQRDMGLTQRPRAMRDHPGQVAFPGGKIDPGEDAITAALREAEEELALPRECVRVIGTTDTYHTGTGFIVTPVLAVVPPGLTLTPNPEEVEAWFEAPLALLLDPASWTTNEVFWRGANRRYLELEWQGFRIWGVTAAIIANLSRRIAWESVRDAA
jgi:8-oxo-dGTP pyrophosphatase MutT (NUDIX family)